MSIETWSSHKASGRPGWRRERRNEDCWRVSKPYHSTEMFRHAWVSLIWVMPSPSSWARASKGSLSDISIPRLRGKVQIISYSPVASGRVAFINPEELIEKVPSSSGLEFSLTARKARQKLPISIKTMWRIFEEPFQRLLDEVKQFGHEISERSMQSFATLPADLAKLRCLKFRLGRDKS